MITQSCGMLSGLMACSHKAYVVDYGMLGVTLSTLSPLEMSETTLKLDATKSVVAGERHFLGHPEICERIQTDFLYPEISVRRSHEDWEANGCPDIRTSAKARARDILNSHCSQHLHDELDKRLHDHCDIRLPTHSMKTS